MNVYYYIALTDTPREVFEQDDDNCLGNNSRNVGSMLLEVQEYQNIEGKKAGEAYLFSFLVSEFSC